MAPKTPSTAAELLDLSNALDAAANALGTAADAEDAKSDPGLPPTSEVEHLRDLAAQVAIQANAIGATGIERLAADMSPAITSLTFQVGQAEHALAKIAEIQKILDVASALLTAAASIAASVSTGNFIGTASAVITLATSLHKTLGPASSAS